MSHRKNPFVVSSTPEMKDLPLEDHIQETGIIEFDGMGEDQAQTDTPSVQTDGDGDLNLKDCITLYGAGMETAHALIATRKEGVQHRELPEERRRLQGKLLYNICKKYDIKVPTELEVLIFGGALIADWQYMTVKESEKRAPPEPVQSATASDQSELDAEVA